MLFCFVGFFCVFFFVVCLFYVFCLFVLDFFREKIIKIHPGDVEMALDLRGEQWKHLRYFHK